MANTNSYIVLTEQGLSAIATQPWPQIAIKYFLPMYDERIDTNIHTGTGSTSALALSASITSAATQSTLVGERIYNIPSTSGTYTLSSKNFITSGVGSSFAGNTLSNTTVTKSSTRTVLNNKTLSPTISGTVEPTYSSVGGTMQYVGGTAAATSVHSWTINGSAIPRNNLFDSVSFNPSQTTSGSFDVVNGLFKFTLRNKVGSYRFNKLAFFIQPMNSDGTVNSSYDPILFGQAAVDVSQVVEVGGQGSQVFEVTLQLAFTMKTGTTLVTNNDYWSMIPTSASTRNQKGLFFPGDVAIGTSAVPNSWQPKAKLHLTDNSSTAHIRLSYDSGTSGADIKFSENSTTGKLAITPATSAYSEFNFVVGNSDVFKVAHDSSNNVKMTVGKGTSAFGINSIALGMNSTAGTSGTMNNSMTFGNNTSSTNRSSYTIGDGSLNTSESSILIGHQSKILDGQNNLALGSSDEMNSCLSTLMIGSYNSPISASIASIIVGNSNALGVNSTNSIIFGNNNAANSESLVFGNNSSGSGSIFGSWSYAYNSALAIGISARAPSLGSISIGFNAKAGSIFAESPLPDVVDAEANIAIGKNSSVQSQASYSIAIGREASVNSIYGYGSAFGDKASSSYKSTSVGAWSYAYGVESVALGFNARASRTTSNPGAWVDAPDFVGAIAIGSNSKSWGLSYGIAIGHSADAFSFGSGSSEFSNSSIAIGRNTVTTGVGSIGLDSVTYPMATIGSELTNDYSVFMAGINPLNRSQMDEKVQYNDTISSWRFIPCAVFGCGPYSSDARNGLMLGYTKTDSEGYKTTVVLDVDNIPVFRGSTDYSSNTSVYAQVPRGTIFKENGHNYGLSLLYVKTQT